MDFDKKMKTRLGIAIGYMALGVVMCVLFSGLVAQNGYAFALGVSLAAVGVLRLIKYFRITRSEESMRSREIAAKDERNVSIAHRARSTAFLVCVLLACAASIVMGLMGRVEIAQWIAGAVCVMVVIYLISYFIIRNKT